MAASLGAVAAELIAEGTSATDVSFMDPARFLDPQRAVTAWSRDGVATYSELL
jgi:sarcosine oxidase